MTTATRERWTTVDFDDLSWHDNAIHGFRIVEGEHGAGYLIFDIDHILVWHREGSTFRFAVAPAFLRFTGAHDLRMTIDYVACNAGLQPPQIEQIQREEVLFPNGYRGHRWCIVLNWPSGEFSFFADGFEMTLWGKTMHGRQSIAPDERVLRELSL